MLKLLGMIFLVLILFFVVFVICVVYKVRATLKTVLGNPNLQHPQEGPVFRTSGSKASGQASDMVIDVEAERKSDQS